MQIIYQGANRKEDNSRTAVYNKKLQKVSQNPLQRFYIFSNFSIAFLYKVFYQINYCEVESISRNRNIYLL